ncbi:DeoR/GlpR family DNA-binding transcription regulator [Paenibacillus cremeus]|uniref:DeoR/GlpR transcriptional regulator n=1 Tax=Paenibacillus cremeus TaxID=2163881 RepID=A0A559KFN9_9BACL|nr:DeoR/GlpR family DNA-binding transcription regulator [Paenibacillus cremeus]TVY10945.1 DeoR/GlpR transcriptional regulator [Paenibacillus cremeus]
MSLTFEHRKKIIVDLLMKEEKVQVHSLSAELHVSAETIRRDLDRLENEGVLRKVYGGAVRARMESVEPSFAHRSKTFAEEKAAIGKLAASLIEQGDTILIDNGTTTLEIVRHLQDRPDVTLLTHSVPVLQLAMTTFKGRILFIGGEVDVETGSATGTIAESLLDQFKVHKSFISVGGISLIDGISDYDLKEARISRKMIERSVETIVLADHSKFGKTTFAAIAPLHKVSMIITDRKCPEEWTQHLQASDIELLIADREE